MARKLTDAERKRRQLIKDYNRTVKRWAKAHARYWDKYAPRPYVASGRESDLNAGQMKQLEAQGRPAWGNPTSSHPPAESMDNRKLQRVTEAMKKELEPAFAKRRVKELRATAKNFASMVGSEVLEVELLALTDEQLERLHRTSDFFAHYDEWYKVQEEGEQAIAEWIDMLIRTIHAASPPTENQKKAVERKKEGLRRSQQREKKLVDYNEQVAARGKTRAEQIEQLKRYGVNPTYSRDPEWYLAYVTLP